MSFLRFTGDTVGDFSQGLEVLENHPGQLVVGGLPLAFLSLGVVFRIRYQRENSLRTSGCINGGR